MKHGISSMIDPEEFLSASIEEQIKMIENAEAPVHLLNVKSRKISYDWESCQSDETYEYRFWYSACNPVYKLQHYSKAANHLLYRKNFVMEGSLSNGRKVRIECGLKEMIINGLSKSTIQEVAMDYYRRGWSTDGFVLSVFTHGQHDPSLEHFALQHNDKSVSDLVHDIYQYACIPSTKSMLMLFEKMSEGSEGGEGGEQELIQKYALEQLRRRPDIDMFDFCVKNGVPVGKLHHQDMERMLDVMPPERYEEVIDQFKKTDHPNYAHIILKRPDLVSDHYISEAVLDAVLFSGTWELMMEMLNRGFRFKDKEYRIYVACQLCHNGENHSCNWRYVSANFVCLKKTGLTLDQLHQAPPKPNKVTTSFDCWYADFNTPANDNELYTACGVDVDWDDDTCRGSYLVPPLKISRS